MQDLSEADMQVSVGGNSPISRWVESVCDWFRCNSAEIGAAYARAAADGCNLM